ncbi:MarR family winged helix-turn-helix transcriptional regulator [Marinospirillum perlucidum]|uniref:MarR family winged helix-turn-helix transcriptional regulator n=1 Tax=Marinospirillum perlucidum TaxID=1982602 RepID=UPI000DF30EAC|nr:MarR family transcriptional regulator [Marinospirillum perlucidum]
MHPYQQIQSLGHLTGLASRLFNQLLHKRFKEAGIELTAEQWGVILVLVNQEPSTQRQIGELLYLEKSSVSRSIKGLEKRGWIQVRKADDDARIKLISLTPQAMSVVDQCSAIARNVLQDAQAGLTADEVAVNQAHLAEIIGNLRKLNES